MSSKRWVVVGVVRSEWREGGDGGGGWRQPVEVHSRLEGRYDPPPRQKERLFTEIGVWHFTPNTAFANVR